MAILNEIEMAYQTDLVKQITPYLGKGYFIHFGKMDKMGVRATNKSHRDPAGVYFYSLDWLVQQPRFIDGNQYAVNYPYWWIVKLQSDTNGVIFSKMNIEEVEQIADRNDWARGGWDDHRTDFLMSKYNKRSAPGLFWNFVKWCGEPSSKLSQGAALKSISYIYDDGLGIIHPMESAQLIVFDPRVIKIVASGQQKNGYDKILGEHRYPFIELIKQLRGEYGGELTWHEKLPTYRVTIKGASFTVKFRPGWDAYINVEIRWGRATKTVQLKGHTFHTNTMAKNISFFEDIFTRYTRLAASKQDLFFNPEITEQEAVVGVKSMVTDGFNFHTEIDNDNETMTVYATKEIKIGQKELSVMAYCLNRDYVRWAVSIKIDAYPVLSCYSPELSGTKNAILKNFQDMLDNIKPETGDTSGRFYFEEDYEAFIGMIAANSGIKIIEETYPKEIAYWNSKQNKHGFYSELKRLY